MSKNSDNFYPNSRDDIIWLEVDGDIQHALTDTNNTVINSGSTMGIAVCSCVKLRDGSMGYIPMMDCTSENDIDKEVTAQWLRENGMHGYMLETDKSFHFWGASLMSETQFRKYMHRCRENITPADKWGVRLIGWPIFCEGFINASIEAQFAALRVFGYENENKKVTPFVTDFI